MWTKLTASPARPAARRSDDAARVKGLLLLSVAFALGCLLPNPDFVDTAAGSGSGGDSAGSGSSGSTAESSGEGGATQTSGEGPMRCADISCPAHATCVDGSGGGECRCDAGFTASQGVCADIDECAQGGCAGVCVNTPGSFRCEFPATCAELRDAVLGASDGETILYVEHDPARPWSAYCHDMAGSPREYLTLPKQGDTINIGSYRGDDSEGEMLRRYQRIRLNPADWLVDTSDATHSSPEGMASQGGGPVDRVAYGTVMTCDKSVAMLTVDLRGTPFHVVGSFCTDGESDLGGSMKQGPQVVTVFAGGACGWTTPADDGCPFNPVNGVGGKLRLSYVGG